MVGVVGKTKLVVYPQQQHQQKPEDIRTKFQKFKQFSKFEKTQIAEVLFQSKIVICKFLRNSVSNFVANHFLCDQKIT